MCDCKWFYVVLALIVVVFTLWVPGSWASWLVVIAGLVLLIMALMGKCTNGKIGAKSKKKK